MEKINIKEIKPAEYNPRRISDEDYEKLQNSISTFGLVDPIIINLRNNVIIGGHQRYKALLDKNVKELQLLKMGDIGYVFYETDFTLPDELHEKGLNLALNKITGEFIEEKLQPVLEELTLSDFNIEVTGFDKLDLDDFTEDLEKETGEIKPPSQNDSQEVYELVITYHSENELKAAYNRFTEEGLTCRTLIL